MLKQTKLKRAPTVDGCEIHFAPRGETIGETRTFVVFSGGEGIVRNQGFFGGAKWSP